MLHLRLFVTASVVALLVALSSGSLQGQLGTCKPTSDTTTAFMESVLALRQNSLEENDPGSVFAGVPLEQIQYVTNDSLCSVAVNAVNALTEGTEHDISAVFVIQVGPRGFFVHLPSSSRHEYLLFTDNWELVFSFEG